MYRFCLLGAVLLGIGAGSALAEDVEYGSPGWEHCFDAPVKSFTLKKGAWRCESLESLRGVDHESVENFQEPDCYRGATPIPADGGVKAMAKFPSRYVSFCWAGQGWYARNHDFN